MQLPFYSQLVFFRTRYSPNNALSLQYCSLGHRALLWYLAWHEAFVALVLNSPLFKPRLTGNLVPYFQCVVLVLSGIWLLLWMEIVPWLSQSYPETQILPSFQILPSSWNLVRWTDLLPDSDYLAGLPTSSFPHIPSHHAPPASWCRGSSYSSEPHSVPVPLKTLTGCAGCSPAHQPHHKGWLNSMCFPHMSLDMQT